MQCGGRAEWSMAVVLKTGRIDDRISDKSRHLIALSISRIAPHRKRRCSCSLATLEPRISSCCVVTTLARDRRHQGVDSHGFRSVESSFRYHYSPPMAGSSRPGPLVTIAATSETLGRCALAGLLLPLPSVSPSRSRPPTRRSRARVSQSKPKGPLGWPAAVVARPP